MLAFTVLINPGEILKRKRRRVYDQYIQKDDILSWVESAQFWQHRAKGLKKTKTNKAVTIS